MKPKLVIDTDIGTDPADAFAIAYAFKNNADVKALTIVQGIPLTRAKIARKLEELLGVKTPITVGMQGPDYKKWIAGFETEALTIAEPTGSPVDGRKLIIRIKDNGTAIGITFNAIFTAIGVTLPTTTTISKVLYIGCIYNSNTTTWDVIAVKEQA